MSDAAHPHPTHAADGALGDAPAVDVAALRAAVEAADRDFRAATPGIDVDTEYRIHLLPVER